MKVRSLANLGSIGPPCRRSLARKASGSLRRSQSSGEPAARLQSPQAYKWQPTRRKPARSSPPGETSRMQPARRGARRNKNVVVQIVGPKRLIHPKSGSRGTRADRGVRPTGYGKIPDAGNCWQGMAPPAVCYPRASLLTGYTLESRLHQLRLSQKSGR
jgi:hypothetical protein